MTTDQLQDKCRGSLLGGAAGDALGYEVEFLSLNSIRKLYGEDGIDHYEPGAQGLANFSDDTQMTLFTADGLLCAVADGKNYEKDILPYISTAYEHWYFTQCRPPLAMSKCWLSCLKDLWTRRAPGCTCMNALDRISRHDGVPVVNNSKGCGGVMRVAPIGIYSAAHPEALNIEKAGLLAGYAADLTHKHPLSTYSSMALAMIVADCISHEKVDRDTFRFIVTERALKLLALKFGKDNYLAHLNNLIIEAVMLATSEMSDTDVIRQLGEGWVAEETLAIAVFSVMRYIDDFEKCLVCSVNHDGDSDSTGAVAGNIIGAILGLEKIPEKFLTNLELKDVIISVADDLCGCSDNKQMEKRYKEHKPYGVEAKLLL